MNEKMERMLAKMVDDFNCYSKSVAWSCAEGEESRFLQWSLGKISGVEEYMVVLARLMGVKLKYGWDFGVYGRGQAWEQEFKHRTVEIVKEG